MSLASQMSHDIKPCHCFQLWILQITFLRQDFVYNRQLMNVNNLRNPDKLQKFWKHYRKLHNKSAINAPYKVYVSIKIYCQLPITLDVSLPISMTCLWESPRRYFQCSFAQKMKFVSFGNIFTTFTCHIGGFKNGLYFILD